jgi:hypothetical protein
LALPTAGAAEPTLALPTAGATEAALVVLASATTLGVCRARDQRRRKQYCYCARCQCKSVCHFVCPDVQSDISLQIAGLPRFQATLFTIYRPNVKIT